jgi:hypothetical protein
MFEIKVADINVTSGAVPVSWCITPELLQECRENNVEDPQIVIVVAPDGDAYHESREARYVVPLRDLLAYIEFRVPGPTKIWAFIPQVGKKSHVKDRYLSKSGHSYSTSILSSDGDMWSYNFSHTGKMIKDRHGHDALEHLPTMPALPLSVDVPKGIFAPEPSEKEKEWVNHLFRYKAEDQCEFRRRRMFAYSIQPILTVFSLVARFAVYLLALLIGAKDATIDQVIHPLTYPLSNIFSLLGGGSYFVRHLPEDDTEESLRGVKEFFSYTARKFCLLPFMPLVILAVGFLAVFMTKLFVIGLVMILGVLVLGLLVLGMVTGTAGELADSVHRLMNYLTGKTSIPEEYWYLNPEEFEMITCSDSDGPRSFESLPSKKKTLKLRYYNLKSKVCRPFSS